MFLSTRFVAAALIGLCATSVAFGAEAANAEEVGIVKIAQAYSDGGGYEWKGTGVPEEIRFEGHQILAKGKSTYCSGFTFAVVMKAAAERGLLKGKSADDVRAFQKEWYGATKASAETQCAYAIEKFGLGTSVKAEDARSGDFLQLWRANKSGHSVVFLDWVTERGRRIGVKYRSSQKLTNGIGDRVEYFEGVKRGSVDRKRMYFARLNESTATRKK
jgi:hypothetical protein